MGANCQGYGFYLVFFFQISPDSKILLTTIETCWSQLLQLSREQKKVRTASFYVARTCHDKTTITSKLSR